MRDPRKSDPNFESQIPIHLPLILKSAGGCFHERDQQAVSTLVDFLWLAFSVTVRTRIVMATAAAAAAAASSSKQQ